jgi:Large polyvalent protein-associated domain 7
MNEMYQKNDNKPSEKESYELPAKIKKKYAVIDGKFYDKDHPEKAHFEDKGKSLTTDRDEREIVIAMLAVAKAKGWNEIEVKGSELFQRYAIIESERIGMKITRHNVKDKEQEANNISLEKAAPIEKDREHEKKDQRSLEAYTGIMIEHGKANYNFDLKETVSYFVKFRTENQTERMVWGIDLERAIAESQAKNGQKISLERQEKQPISQDKEGNTPEREAPLFRTVWQVKVLDQEIRENFQKKDKENEQEDVAIVAARKVLQDTIKKLPTEKQKQIIQKFNEKIKSYTDKGMSPPLSKPIIRTQEKVAMDMTPQKNKDRER